MRAISACVVSGLCTQTKCVLDHIPSPYIVCIRYHLLWAAGYASLFFFFFFFLAAGNASLIKIFFSIFISVPLIQTSWRGTWHQRYFLCFFFPITLPCLTLTYLLAQDLGWGGLHLNINSSSSSSSRHAVCYYRWASWRASRWRYAVFYCQNHCEEDIAVYC